MKKTLSLILTVCTLLGAVVYGGAPVVAEGAVDGIAASAVMVDVEIDYSTAQHNENGTIYYDILNVEELANAWGLSPEKVREMKFLAIPAQDEFGDVYGVSPTGLFSRIEIQNITSLGQSCRMQVVVDEWVQNYSSATITRSKELSATVSHTYATSVETGIEVEGVTIGNALGFDITREVTVTETITVEVEPGESVEIIAVPLCNGYEFDVYEWRLFAGTNYVGNGYAYQVIGLCVTVYDR